MYLFENSNSYFEEKFEEGILSNYYIPFNLESNDNFTISDNDEQKFFINPNNQSKSTIIELDETPTITITKKNEKHKKTTKDHGGKTKIPDYYSSDKIKKLLEDKNINNISNLFLEDEKLTDAEDGMQLIRRKKIRSESWSDETSNDIEIEIKHRRGRKDKNDMSQRNHDKYKDDNIMKKLKTKLFVFVVKYVNVFCQEFNVILKELDYKKYINHLRKKENLKFLHLPLKDLLSLEVSPRYKNNDINSNKNDISMLLETIEKEKKEENEDKKKLVENVLNMKFREWLDVFTMKEDVGRLGNITEDTKSKLPTVNDLVNDFSEKKVTDDYLSLLLFYLYNYEKWFINRSSRNRSK